MIFSNPEHHKPNEGVDCRLPPPPPAMSAEPEDEPEFTMPKITYPGDKEPIDDSPLSGGSYRPPVMFDADAEDPRLAHFDLDYDEPLETDEVVVDVQTSKAAEEPMANPALASETVEQEAVPLPAPEAAATSQADPAQGATYSPPASEKATEQGPQPQPGPQYTRPPKSVKAEFKGFKEPPKDMTMDTILADLGHVNVHAPAPTATRILGQTVAQHVTRQRQAFKEYPAPVNAKTVIAADFSTGPTLDQVRRPEGGWYKAVDLTVGQLVETFPAEEALDMLAAASYEDFHTVVDAARLLHKVGAVLLDHPDPATGGKRVDKLYLPELRDALLVASASARIRTNETQTLDRGVRKAISEAVVKEESQASTDMLRHIAAIVRYIAPDTPPHLQVSRSLDERRDYAVRAKAQHPLARMSLNGVTVVSIGVHGRTRLNTDASRAVLAQALPAALRGNKMLPNPSAAVVAGAHHAPPGLQMTVDIAREELKMPLVLEGRYEESALPCYAGGHSVVGAQASYDEAVQLSARMGTHEVQREQSISYGKHGSENTGENDGGNNSYELGSQPKGGGTSWGNQQGRGISYDLGGSRVRVEEPVHKPDLLAKGLEPDEVVMHLGNSSLGIWNTRTGRFVRPAIKPSDPKTKIHQEAEDMIQRIDSDHDAALTAGNSNPANAAALAQGIQPKDLPPAIRKATALEPQTRSQRRQELELLYRRTMGTSKSPFGRGGKIDEAALKIWYQNKFLPSYRGPDDGPSRRQAWHNWLRNWGATS